MSGLEPPRLDDNNKSNDYSSLLFLQMRTHFWGPNLPDTPWVGIGFGCVYAHDIETR